MTFYEALNTYCLVHHLWEKQIFKIVGCCYLSIMDNEGNNM